jgi:hypothetical protein
VPLCGTDFLARSYVKCKMKEINLDGSYDGYETFDTGYLKEILHLCYFIDFLIVVLI